MAHQLQTHIKVIRQALKCATCVCFVQGTTASAHYLTSFTTL